MKLSSTAKLKKSYKVNVNSTKKAKKKSFKKTNIYVLVLFSFWVFAWYLQLSSRWNFLGKIRFEFLSGLVLIFFAYSCHEKREVKPTGLLNIVICYFCVCLFSFIFSPNIEQSWFVFYTYVIKYSCMSLFIYEFVVGPRELKFFLITLFLAWLKLGQEGLLGTITGGMIWMNQGVMRLHGPTGLYFHPNSFAGLAIGTLPFIYYFFPIIKNKILRVALITQLVFSINIILHSGSRTSYVGLIGFLLYSFFQSKRKIMYLLCCFSVVYISFQLIPQQYTDRFETIFTGKDKEGHSTLKRKQLIVDAIIIFLDHPLGIGVSSFEEVRLNYFGRNQDTHNLYLEIATNIGVQGIVVFAILIYKIFTTLSKVIKSAKKQLAIIGNSEENNSNSLIQSSDLKLIIATAEAVKMFIFLRLVLGLFGHDLYEIYWWLGIGIASSLFYIIQVSEIKMKEFYP